jgi:hypothetical protein
MLKTMEDVEIGPPFITFLVEKGIRLLFLVEGGSCE